jgi:hypothetical protein
MYITGYAYPELLRLAQQRRARGTKWRLQRFARLDPDNPELVQVGHYPRCGFSWRVKKFDKTRNREYDHWESGTVDLKDRPFVLELTVGPDHFITHVFGPTRRWSPELPPELQAKYPHYKPAEPSVRNYVDIGFNNLLANLCRPGAFHSGARDKPGFMWSWGGPHHNELTHIVGDIRADVLTGRFEPTTAQPKRVVDEEQRKLIASRLRAAFKRLRLLSRVGAEFTVEDYKHAVSDVTPETLTTRFKELKDPDKLLDALETVNFENRDAVLEINMRCAAVLARQVFYSNNLAKALHNQFLPTGMLDNESQLTALRRHLNKAYETVRYTHD